VDHYHSTACNNIHVQYATALSIER